MGVMANSAGFSINLGVMVLGLPPGGGHCFVAAGTESAFTLFQKPLVSTGVRSMTDGAAILFFKGLMCVLQLQIGFKTGMAFKTELRLGGSGNGIGSQ